MQRRYPIGAELTPQGVSFRVYAPQCHSVTIVSEKEPHQVLALTAEKNGYYTGISKDFSHNSLYRLRLDDQPELYADPASRFQPSGPFGPSQVINPTLFKWTDEAWTGKKIDRQVIYEMHIGTFTPEGTYQAAAEQLKELADLGITVLEIMPLNEFPGEFGWGYDGVNLYAPTNLYGTPDELRFFINQAHALNIAVLIDVVYNHFGPEGNFIDRFAPNYFQEKDTEWGRAINFDDAETRLFFLTNILYWIQEFHFDGIRVDATQAIHSEKLTPHILQEITQTAHSAAPGRTIIVIGENEPQHTRLMYPIEKGGYGFDAIWNDDFHHTAIVRMTGRKEAYYSDYQGHAQEFLSCLKYGFLYQGQYYAWQKNSRGTPCLDLPPASFILFLQNHDQVANSGTAQRISQLTDSGTLKTMTCLLLLGPGVPMLFQGQEFGSTHPFYYFAHHERDLSRLVNEGRKEFLAQFPHLGTEEMSQKLKNPSDKQTFINSKLNFAERETNKPLYQLHKDLIRLRKHDPVFSTITDRFDGAVFNQDAFVLRFFDEVEGDRLILFNFGADYELNCAPEPLLAPCWDSTWELMWSTEDVKYGGQSTPPLSDGIWKLQGRSAVILKTVRK